MTSQSASIPLLNVGDDDDDNDTEEIQMDGQYCIKVINNDRIVLVYRTINGLPLLVELLLLILLEGVVVVAVVVVLFS